MLSSFFFKQIMFHKKSAVIIFSYIIYPAFSISVNIKKLFNAFILCYSSVPLPQTLSIWTSLKRESVILGTSWIKLAECPWRIWRLIPQQQNNWLHTGHQQDIQHIWQHSSRWPPWTQQHQDSSFHKNHSVAAWSSQLIQLRWWPVLQ